DIKRSTVNLKTSEKIQTWELDGTLSSEQLTQWYGHDAYGNATHMRKRIGALSNPLYDEIRASTITNDQGNWDIGRTEQIVTTISTPSAPGSPTVQRTTGFTYWPSGA